jgi:hypothetical protein
MIDLKTLPADHPLRNRPLAEIGAEYSNRGGPWKQVLPSYRIAKACYNALGDIWTTHDEWRCTDET